MLKTLSLSLILFIGRGIYTQAEASAPVTAKNSSSVVAEKSAPVAAENFPVKATGDFSFKAEKGDFSENTTSPCTPAPLSYRESKGTFRWKPSTPIRYQADTDTTILRTALADFQQNIPHHAAFQQRPDFFFDAGLTGLGLELAQNPQRSPSIFVLCPL